MSAEHHSSLNLHLSSPLQRLRLERAAAAARFDGVRVIELEAAGLEAFVEIDGCAIEIEGTFLVDHDGHMSVPVREAARDVVAAGHHVTIATERRVVLEPVGLSLSPQLLESSELTAVVDLIETTGSEDTTPAPWWTEVEVQPEPPPDNVTYLDSRSTWGTADTAERALIMEAAMEAGRTVHHPILQLLGPIELLGATGTVPPRAAKQCLEYCAWLLENPGRTAQVAAKLITFKRRGLVRS